MNARFALKGATTEAHERLDRLYGRFDLTTLAGYGDFLLAHAPAYFAAEAALEAAGLADLAPGWSERRRADALRQDIAGLGLDVPAAAAAPTFANAAQALGGAYVLEGSRLGGAVLIRTVAPGLPTAFLMPGNPGAWRAFLTLLEKRLSSNLSLADAISAAQAVFALFEHSARARLEMLGCDF